MSGFIAEIDADAAGAAKEAATGSGEFPPLAPGKYQAIVEKVIGVQDFGGTGGNAKKKVVRLQFKIVDDSPTGAKRVYFDRIPLFTRFAPSEKNPQGAAARGFWDFWGKAIGVPQDQLILGNLPGPEGVQGKQVSITLGKPIAPDDYNPLGSNEISFYDAAGDVNASPTHAPAAVLTPWLDDKGKLIGGAAPASRPAATQVPATAPAWGAPAAEAPAWTPDPADVAAAPALVGATF
jgi:hypothetical protein